MTAPNSNNEKPTKTIHFNAGSMWCETCLLNTPAVWTTIKIYRNGREVERQKCDECTSIQETEYFTGPTTQIKNKRDK